MSNTARQTQTQTQDQAQAQTETTTQAESRERMDLTPWLTEITHPTTSEVLGKGLVLDNASHLEESEKGRETAGGLLKGFVDPVSGKPCTFTNAKGEVIVGGCPIRLFQDDAAALIRTIGEPEGKDSQLILLLEAEADAAVYRKESGEVAFLVLRRNQIRGAALQVAKVAKLW